LPSTITFAAGETSVFLPVLMTEDVIPEWTELFQVRIKPSPSFYIESSETGFASLTILDDDYFYIGSFEANSGDIPYTAENTVNGVTTTQAGDIDFQTGGNELQAVVGLVDGDWIPRVIGEVTSAGADYREFWDRSVAAESDGSYTPSGEPIVAEAQAAALPGDSLAHARNLAILAEHEPGYSFEVDPNGQTYVGTDAQGRLKQYNLRLEQVAYKGTHQGWHLRFNDDGSIERWGGEFVHDPKMVGRVRPPDEELREEINRQRDKNFAAYFDQLHEQEVARQSFNEFSDELAEVLQTALSLAPGAIVVDLHQGLTGEDAYNPGARLSGGERAVSLASASPLGIVGAVKAGKKLLTAGERIRENYRVGNAFQTLVTDALGEARNRTTKYRVTLASGRIYTTIPDIVSMAGNSIIEIKRIIGVPSLTPQLEAQIKAARREGLKYRLILAGGTAADVVGSVKIEIDASNNLVGGSASILKFDVDTRKLIAIYPAA
jgi:hypothetical protein